MPRSNDSENINEPDRGDIFLNRNGALFTTTTLASSSFVPVCLGREILEARDKQAVHTTIERKSNVPVISMNHILSEYALRIIITLFESARRRYLFSPFRAYFIHRDKLWKNFIERIKDGSNAADALGKVLSMYRRYLTGIRTRAS